MLGEIVHVIRMRDGTLWVRGTVRGIAMGAYLDPGGRVLLTDHQEWRWEDDVERAGARVEDWPALRGEWMAYLRSLDWGALAARAVPVAE